MSSSPQPQGVDPVALLTALKELVGTPIKERQPVYRPGFTPPAKPDPTKAIEAGQRLYDQALAWRVMIAKTLLWTRQDLTGSFPEDLYERELGFQEEYISPVLSADRNILISKGAALTPSFRSLYAKTDKAGYAQKLEDTVRWLRCMEELRHAETQRPLALDEWALFTDYGMYAVRSTLAPKDAECPIDSRLVDPTQVYPVFDRKAGVQKVYRVYRDTAEALLAEYGDLPDGAIKKLKNEVGADDFGQTEVTVTEYWDSWWRFVAIGDMLVLPVTAHKYGDCPWTIQFGGYGEPMFTSSPLSMAPRRIDMPSGNRQAFGLANRGDERVAKAVPYLYYTLRSHDIYESVMARVLTGFKKEINPPTIRERSDLAAEKPMSQLDASAGAQNEILLGEERIQPLPTATGPITSMIVQGVIADRAKITVPPEMYGLSPDKSNITGQAQAGQNDAGMHLLFPGTKSWEMALARKYDREVRMLANFYDLVKYGASDTPRGISLPTRRKQSGPYEFDPQVIDEVGSRVEIKFTKVDPRDWAGLFAAGKNGVDAGFVLPAEIRALATGDTDYDAFFEEWQEEQMIRQAFQLPEFAKAIAVPAAIKAEIAENQGRPEIQRRLQELLDGWVQFAMPPPQPPPGGGAPPSPAGNPMATPGGPGGMSYPALGQGPGSQGQPVGRPY